MPLKITYPDLPVAQYRAEIKKAISENQIVIIAGETGSGKTTQLPKMCLELGRKMIGHTQPRRLAARTVAERIATELNVEIGAEVGYQVRFNDKSNPKTCIKVMTDGILLNEIHHDKLLRAYDTLIIDEAHERSLNIDFILGYLKRLLPKRPNLKVIITSATIDPERFSEHFDDAPIMTVSGRTYPVEVRYRPLRPDPFAEVQFEERELNDGICDAVLELRKETAGDILVFLPGEREIKEAATALRGLTQKIPRLANTEVLPLFARLSLAEQHQIFTPGKNPRIVLATNVAETSLTVPGIKYVVDSGLARVSRYSNRTKVQRLPIEDISQASANQRSGRCGRVSDGIAIRLYSESDFQSRSEFTDPEIRRTNLSAVILQMLILGFAHNEQSILNFPFVERPAMSSVGDGLQVLTEIGAINRVKGTRKRVGKVRLTRIGRDISKVPVDPRFARMLIEAKYRACVQEVLIIVAGLSIQDPRERPHDDADKAQEFHKRFTDSSSDFISYLKLWQYTQEQQNKLSSSQFRKLCRKEFLNYLRIREWQDMYRQLRQAIAGIGIKAPKFNAGVNPARNEEAVHKSILSALLSQIGYWDEVEREYRGARGVRFSIFPGSALFNRKEQRTPNKKQKVDKSWIVTAELVETSKMWARVNAVIDSQWVADLAGSLAKTSYSEPAWFKDRGSVMARKKVTVYGLPVVSDRLVQYGKIDPEFSRELFIWHALVQGEWRTHFPFYKHNKQLLAEVEAQQERMRRYDMRVDDQEIYDFYDSQLPTHIISTVHFNKWYKRASYKNKKLLYFSEDLVRSEEAEEFDDDEYPVEWEQAPFTFRLDYSYEEGPSVLIPIAVLNQVQDVGFDWVVPGFRLELITALIKSLPKAIRKNYVPANDTANRALVALDEDINKSLTSELSSVLRDMRGTPIPETAWDWEKVPKHLKMNFIAVEADGKRIAASYDLVALKNKLRNKARQAVAKTLIAGDTNGKQAIQQVTNKKVTSMPKQNLSVPIERELAGHKIKGYPALVDEGKTVALTISDTEVTAKWHNKRGITRLLLLELPEFDGFIQNHLTANEKLLFTNTVYPSMKALLGDCKYTAVQNIVSDFNKINTQVEFYEVACKVKEQAIDETFEVVKQVAAILTAKRDCEKQLKRTSSLALMNSITDIKNQLESLVYQNFIRETVLVDILRYLQATVKRIQKMEDNANRDHLNMLKVKALETEYHAQVKKAGFELAGNNIVQKDQPAPAYLVKVRWMIEEYRISLFTPEIKTAYSVSDKRIRKVLYP
ncbi:MAG: ATP-dependent RNA helicase HrpA [Micrococcaceae bacterium]